MRIGDVKSTREKEALGNGDCSPREKMRSAQVIHGDPAMAYSIKEVCRIVGVGRTMVYSLIKQGDLSALKIGRRTLVRADALRALLDSRPTAGRSSVSAQTTDEQEGAKVSQAVHRNAR